MFGYHTGFHVRNILSGDNCIDAGCFGGMAKCRSVKTSWNLMKSYQLWLAATFWSLIFSQRRRWCINFFSAVDAITELSLLGPSRCAEGLTAKSNFSEMDRNLTIWLKSSDSGPAMCGRVGLQVRIKISQLCKSWSFRSVSLANTAGESALSLCVKNAHEAGIWLQWKNSESREFVWICCVQQGCLETMLRAGAPVNVSNRTTGTEFGRNLPCENRKKVEQRVNNFEDADT